MGYDFREKGNKGTVDSSLLSFGSHTLKEAGLSCHKDAQAALWKADVVRD